MGLILQPEDSDEDVFFFSIDEDGISIGTISAIIRDRDIFIGEVDIEKRKITPREAISLKNQLKEFFPGAETVSGIRTSGANPVRSVEVDFK